jgi:hypothetical protein
MTEAEGAALARVSGGTASSGVFSLGARGPRESMPTAVIATAKTPAKKLSLADRRDNHRDT